ncbi:MAG: hypothetical protein AB7S26_31460 [Sandaracinaceae bacterium]
MPTATKTAAKKKAAKKKTVRSTSKKSTINVDSENSWRTVQVSESVAQKIRALMHEEMGEPPRGEADRMIGYCAYYDPPGICICFGPVK